MSEPYTREQVESIRNHPARNPDAWRTEAAASQTIRWLATLDARDAEIAALKKERDEARRMLAEARGCVASNFGPNEGTRLLARIDAFLRPATDNAPPRGGKED